MEQKDLIIGAFNNYTDYDVLKPWVQSIKDTGFKGDVVLIAIGTTPELIKKLIEEGVIVNNQVLIEHDCLISSFVHLSPSVNIAGSTKIGELSWIGIGSNIIQSLNITNNVIVGAGSTVIDSIKRSGTYVGAPARLVNKL